MTGFANPARLRPAQKQTRGIGVSRGRGRKGRESARLGAVSNAGWGISGASWEAGGRQFEPVSRIPESRIEFLGLIAFLIPKGKIIRLTHRSLPARSRRPTPEGRNAVPNAHAIRAARGRVSPLTGRLIPAPKRKRLQHANWRVKAPPESPGAEPREGPAVAIPFTKTKGFFPLTDVRSRRENSVPTCKRGICVPSSNWHAGPGPLRNAGP